MNELIDSIKELIYHSPSRNGRIFFVCDITPVDNTLTVKFTPSREFLDSDYRRDQGAVDSGEAQWPDFLDINSKYHTMGMAVGLLELFLSDNNLSFTLDDSRLPDYVEVIINV
jgi:hypothetical protein